MADMTTTTERGRFGIRIINVTEGPRWFLYDRQPGINDFVGPDNGFGSKAAAERFMRRYLAQHAQGA